MSGLFDWASPVSKTGGAKKKRSGRKVVKKAASVKKDSTYKRTRRVHTSKSGTKRTVYTKDGKDYVKRVSSKSGKVRFQKL